MFREIKHQPFFEQCLSLITDKINPKTPFRRRLHGVSPSELWDKAQNPDQSFCPLVKTSRMRLLLIPGGKTNLLHDKRQAYRYYGILLLLTEWIQVECLYISLLDQIVTHGQHRYLQGNLEMWFRDHYPVVTNPTVKSYVITLSFQEIILMAENHYPKLLHLQAKTQ